MIVFNLEQFGQTRTLSGGMMYILQLAKVLNEGGIRACILFPKKHDFIPEKYLPFCIFGELPKEWWRSVRIIPEVEYRKYYAQNATIPLFQGFAMGTELKYAINPSITTTPYMRGLINARGTDCFLLPLFIDKSEFDKKIPSKKGVWQPTLTPMKESFNVNRAEVIPSVKRDIFLKLLSEIEHFVYPVVKEGFGLPVMEAMASECIVYSGDLKGNSGFIRDGVTGYWITNNADFEEKFSKHKKIGKQAREYVMTYHTDEACRDEVCYVFSQIIRRLQPYL